MWNCPLPLLGPAFSFDASGAFRFFPFAASAFTHALTRMVRKNLGSTGWIEPSSGRSGNTLNDLKIEIL